MKKKGFTLMETMIALGIFAITTTAIISFIMSSFRVSAFGQEQNDAIESARNGIDKMVTEIREGGQSAEGGYLILDNEEQALTFYSDVDRDGELEQISYW